MFNVGDSIVYPLHGAGKIDAIEEKEISGEKHKYYVIKLPNEVKAMVPVNRAEEMGVRMVIGQEGVDKVFRLLEQNETEMSDNWNKRYRDNLEKIKTGDVFEVADVVRNLSFKQKERGTLSTIEKKMLSNAKVILVSELSLAQDSDSEEIEELVNNKIEMSYKEYNIPTESKIDLHHNAVNKFIPFTEHSDGLAQL